ncbi:MAG TPA: exodeoxyribonuclease VII small subunit [Dissulfurispiraceae bacterium]|nr:exodeoxyribonuclease VII small subunit [Dissulfurispiraceae bacterium]
MSKSEQPAYSQALMELEQIISEIETEDVDVDVLAGKVKRAVLLVKLCKTRLRNAEEEVKKIMAEIEVDSNEDSELAEDDEPAV